MRQAVRRSVAVGLIAGLAVVTATGAVAAAVAPSSPGLSGGVFPGRASGAPGVGCELEVDEVYLKVFKEEQLS